ncbi:type I secretion system permease/ATPase [Rhodovibrionaceae bacterium A322]
MTSEAKSGQKKVWQILGKCVPGLFLSYVTSAALVLLSLALPLFLVQVFTRIAPSRSLSSLMWLSVIVIGAVIVYALFSYLRNRVQQRIGEWLERRFLLEGLEPLVSKSLQSESDPITTFDDVKKLRAFLSSDQLPLAFEATLVPVFLLFLYLLHPLFAMIAVAFVGLLGVLAYLNELISADKLVATGRTEGAVARDLSGIIRNAEVLEAMGMFGALLTRWWGGNNETQRNLAVSARRGAILLALAQAVTMIASVVMLAAAGLLVINEEASLVSLLAAMLVTTMLLNPFQRIISGWPQWVEARQAIKRLSLLLTEAENQRSSTQLPAPDGILNVERLVYVPPESSKPALRGLSFQANPGEAIAVIGPSASGKSTLARILVGLWQPTAGAVHLDGHDVYTWDRTNFGHYVGYLPQRVDLFTGTIRENISRMQDCEAREVVEAARLAGVHDAIGRMKLGYDTIISDGSYLLTGSQRQLIGLARALFRRPRMLVLDEPDSNLDGEGVATLMRAVRQIRANGTIVIVMTHRSEILDAVDKVLALREGSMHIFAPVQQWRKSGRVTKALPKQVRRLAAPANKNPAASDPSDQASTDATAAQQDSGQDSPAETVAEVVDVLPEAANSQPARSAGKGPRG